MAKAKRYWYEVLKDLDVGWYGPDQRKERWPIKGGIMIQPQHVKHSLRVRPSRGYNARGEQFPPDYIVTDRPVSRNLTEEVTKNVSRPKYPAGGSSERIMREKTSEPKLRLLEPEEVTEYVRRTARDMEWSEDLYQDATEDVYLPAEATRMLKGRGVNESVN